MVTKREEYRQLRERMNAQGQPGHSCEHYLANVTDTLAVVNHLLKRAELAPVCDAEKFDRELKRLEDQIIRYAEESAAVGHALEKKANAARKVRKC